MSGFIQRVMRIQPGEGRKVVLFIALGALLQCGLAIGMSAVDAIFLTGAGASRLPLVYVLTPVVMLIYIPVFSYLLARFGVDRVFDLTLAILVTGGLLLYWLFSGGHVPADGTEGLYVLLAVKLYANMWLFALYTLYWNFADGYFDIVDAKRFFAFFSGGCAFGAIVGGGLVTVLSRLASVHNLFLVWSATALMTVPLLVHLRRTCVKIEVSGSLDETEPGFVDQLRGIVTTLRTSRYVRVLTVGMFLTLSVTLVCEYQYMNIFSDYARTAVAGSAENMATAAVDAASEQKLASLFGMLGSLANAFNLLFNLLLFNRLIAWLGVRNATLIQPLVYIGTFTFLLLHYGFASAVVGFFAFQGVMIAVEQNNQNFLFNALPAGVKKQLRTFVEGIAEPLAVAVAGIFLLLYGQDIGGGGVDGLFSRLFGDALGASLKVILGVGKLTESGISMIGLSGAVVCLGLAWILREDYVVAMVQNLKRGWLDFSRSSREALDLGSETEQAAIAGIVRTGEVSAAMRAVRVLLDYDIRRAGDAWFDFWKQAGPVARVEAQETLVEILRRGDTDTTRAVVEWMERERVDPVPALVEELGRRGLAASGDVTPWLTSPDHVKRGAASVALWSSWQFNRNVESAEAIQQLLKGNEAERQAAVRALGMTGREEFAHDLVRFIEDHSQPVRLETLAAIHRLAGPSLSRLLPTIMKIVGSGSHEERDLAFGILDRIGDTGLIMPLLQSARTFTPSEKREAGRILERIGLQGVPAVATALQRTSTPYRGRSIAARALARMAFPQFEVIAPRVIDSEIRRAYQFVVFQSELEHLRNPTPGLSLLRRIYADIQVTVVDFILELLTLQGQLPSFELMAANLRSSNPKEHGDAVETLEQGCSRAVFQALFPLIDFRGTEAKAALAGAMFDAERVDPPALIRRAVESSVAIECVTALLVALETGWVDARETLRRVLISKPEKWVRQNVLQLLDKSSDPGLLADIEKAGQFLETEWFKGFNAMDVVYTLSGSCQIKCENGRTLYREGDAADGMYLVTEGRVEVARGSACRVLTTGNVFGEESMLGPCVRKESAVSGGSSLLCFRRDAMLEAARVFPGVAIELLKRRVNRWS